MKGLHQLVTNESQDTLENYMISTLAHKFLKALVPPELIDNCINLTEKKFSSVLTSIFVKSNSLEKSALMVKEAKEIFKIMKETFKQNIKTSNKMNQAYIQRAEDKLDKLETRIGYPKSILNDIWLDQCKCY